MNIADGEQGNPESSPDSLHWRPGLLKRAAFSGYFHCNNRPRDKRDRTSFLPFAISVELPLRPLRSSCVLQLARRGRHH